SARRGGRRRWPARATTAAGRWRRRAARDRVSASGLSPSSSPCVRGHAFPREQRGKSWNRNRLTPALVVAEGQLDGDRASGRHGERITLLVRLNDAVGMAGARDTDDVGLERREPSDDFLQAASERVTAITRGGHAHEGV